MFDLLDPRDAEDVYPDAPRGMTEAEAAYEELDIDDDAGAAAWVAKYNRPAAEQDDGQVTAQWVAGLVRAAEIEAEG